MSFSVFQTMRGFMPHDAARLTYRLVRPDRFGEFEDMHATPPSEHTNISFIPLQETRSNFVHVPKAAGASVGRALYGCHTGHHMNLLDYRTAFTKMFFDAAFKFTFVRNPWDRLVSAYFYLRQDTGLAFNRAQAEKSVTQFDTFEDFVTDFMARKDFNSILHLREQHLFLRLPWRGIGVDFVGRYESLHDDFAFIAKRLDRDIALEHRNASALRKHDYRDLYTPACIDIVSRAYAKDIEYFGYRFEG